MTQLGYYRSNAGPRLRGIGLVFSAWFKPSEVFELSELRDRLGVPAGKLPRWSNFKQKVLDVAISEVKHLSGFIVNYEQVKRCRSVVAVRLLWDAEDQVKPVKPLLGPQGSVKPRRDVNPQRARKAFPATGTIEFSKPWDELAKLNGNGKDKGAIRQAFHLMDQTTRRHSQGSIKCFSTVSKDIHQNGKITSVPSRGQRLTAEVHKLRHGWN